MTAIFNSLSFKKRAGLTLFRQYKKSETKQHTLRYLMWECTLRCNFSCKHCGSDCHKDNLVKDMPVVDFLRVIDDVNTIVQPEETMIVFTGGEPLMRNDLEVAGKALNNLRFPWGVVTNGYLLTSERLQSLIGAGMHAITISLDGFEITHNWLRGIDGSFHKAINAIALVAQTNLAFDVVTCVNPRNYNELEQLRLLLIDLGVKNWRLFTIFPSGRAKNNHELSLSNHEFKALFQQIKQWRTLGDIQVSYGCEGFLGELETEVRDQFYFCRAGINVASVLADGAVAGCNSINHRYTQGNIYKQPFSEIWQSRFQLMRERSWMKTGKCEKCRHFNDCLGNGFHLRSEKGELVFCHLEKLQ